MAQLPHTSATPSEAVVQRHVVVTAEIDRALWPEVGRDEAGRIVIDGDVDGTLSPPCSARPTSADLNRVSQRLLRQAAGMAAAAAFLAQEEQAKRDADVERLALAYIEAGRMRRPVRIVDEEGIRARLRSLLESGAITATSAPAPQPTSGEQAAEQ